ncbi:MAG TPA: 8-amino-7-oxononanoate synthase [Chlorobaculum parvum]|uniref:8-amino-7-oxononanoate synthase n=1 Tax=Chlorobaculum parvum TaxID=274539 RepID=A0A7C5HHF6_9CHLB|nr:8-amino-7-oxononanoate synthase [Chlorobaculum parvum]
MSQQNKKRAARAPLPVELHMQQELDTLKARQRYRAIPEIGERRGPYITIGERTLLNLSSNDYLGLGADRELFASWMGRVAADGGADGWLAMTSTSSRLLTGNHKIGDGLESVIAENYGREAALVFNSGYHANTGILPALSTRHDLILSDRLNHASIIDGLRIADAEYRRYHHADYDHLEQLLCDAAGRYRQLFIVTESVFSMDGDLADMKRLVELKKHYDAVLIVDEAHGAGVYGQRGLGLCEALGLVEEIDILIGTFGKAMASVGAYAVMRSLYREYLVNTMRTLIFTTALPPLVLAWSRMTFTRQLEMQQEREHLLGLAARLRTGLRAVGFDSPGDSHIVPVLLGEDCTAVAVSAALREAGFHALPVRPPTVPENSARLRFSLRADFEVAQIDELVNAMTALRL